LGADIAGRTPDHDAARSCGDAGRRLVYQAEGASGQGNQEGKFLSMRADGRGEKRGQCRTPLS